MIYTTTNSVAGSRHAQNRLHYLAKRSNNSLSHQYVTQPTDGQPSPSSSSSSSSNTYEPPGPLFKNPDKLISSYSNPLSNSPYHGLNSRTVLTHSSSFSSSLKKRCHSSPTKYHSPYTTSGGSGHLNCMVSTMIQSRDCNTPLFSTGTFSPPPDPTNKKFKGSSQVQFPKLNLISNQNPASSSTLTTIPLDMSLPRATIDSMNIVKEPSNFNFTSQSSISTSAAAATTTQSSSLFVSPPTSSSNDSSAQQTSPKNDKELGQLTQDFDRLKTPFQ